MSLTESHRWRRRAVLRSQHGITGLETAIILIAFVIVASVFSFTILSVGVFSSERSKEAIIGGLEDSQNTLAPKGGIVAEAATVGGGATGLGCAIDAASRGYSTVRVEP
jgi:flagellin-like protein